MADFADAEVNNAAANIYKLIWIYQLIQNLPWLVLQFKNYNIIGDMICTIAALLVAWVMQGWRIWLYIKCMWRVWLWSWSKATLFDCFTVVGCSYTRCATMSRNAIICRIFVNNNIGCTRLGVYCLINDSTKTISRHMIKRTNNCTCKILTGPITIWDACHHVSFRFQRPI
jgi:hypothetical protein